MKWFKRKKRNRRFTRRHVLDVKLSATQRRQTRLRRLSLLLAVSLSVFFGLLAVWRGGEWTLRRFIYENPAFAIHHLQVETDGVISLEQLRHWAGVKLNDNLWAVDLARIKRDLELIPMIDSASIERILPHTLRIKVEERQPVAQYLLPKYRPETNLPDVVYLLDGQGYVMFPLEPHQRAVPAATNEHLPVLIGLPPTELSPGRQIDSPQVRAALQWIENFARSPLAGSIEIKQIDLGQPNVLMVNTGNGTELVFGLADIERQLHRWRLITDHGQKTGKHLVWADLSVANNAPTRWMEATLAPPIPVELKPPQTTRSRKKNV